MLGLGRGEGRGGKSSKEKKCEELRTTVGSRAVEIILGLGSSNEILLFVNRVVGVAGYNGVLILTKQGVGGQDLGIHLCSFIQERAKERQGSGERHILQ